MVYQKKKKIVLACYKIIDTLWRSWSAANEKQEYFDKILVLHMIGPVELFFLLQK